MADGSRLEFGVRARLTLVAVLVVGIVLVIGATALLWLAGTQEEDSIIEGAETRLESLITLAELPDLQDPLPGRSNDFISQIIGPDGEVLASDRILGGTPALLAVDLEPGARDEFTSPDLLEPFEDFGVEDEGPYRVFVAGARLADGSRGTVLVAASLEPAEKIRQTLLPLLAFGLPLLAAFVAGTTWILTGRALKPVDRIRTEALTISGADLHRRLPVPVARDEIQRLALSLNEMLARLETSANQQRSFVADASHELRSPLASLRTMLEVAAAEPDPDLQAGLLRDVEGEVDRMQHLVDDLLYLASYDEAGPAGRTYEEVDVDQILGREASLLARRSSVLVDTTGVEPARVMGDGVRLSQLVRNLIDNAARFAATQVWVTSFEDGVHAVVQVSDDGPGIPAAERERVFDRFVRLDESRARMTGGAGLGLAVSRSIARNHGGDVRVAEPVHGGATMEVRLPLIS